MSVYSGSVFLLFRVLQYFLSVGSFRVCDSVDVGQTGGGRGVSVDQRADPAESIGAPSNIFQRASRVHGI